VAEKADAQTSRKPLESDDVVSPVQESRSAKKSTTDL
jgi:hypothetical protein